MIANDLDATIAGEVAKRLILYARRPGYQSQFSPVLKAQVQGNSPFADLIGWIQSNLDAPLDVPSLADRAGLTERTFHRKFVAATGETPAPASSKPPDSMRRFCPAVLPRNRWRHELNWRQWLDLRKRSSAALVLPRNYSATCMPNFELL